MTTISLCPSLLEHIQWPGGGGTLWFAIFKRIHEVWMPRTLQKIFDFWIFCSSMRRLTRFLRVRLMKFWYIWQFFFSSAKRVLQGKKCTALFQFHNSESFSLLGQKGLTSVQVYRIPLKRWIGNIFYLTIFSGTPIKLIFPTYPGQTKKRQQSNFSKNPNQIYRDHLATRKIVLREQGIRLN